MSKKTKIEITTMSISKMTDDVIQVNVTAEYFFRNFESCIINHDEPNEIHSTPDGFADLVLKLIINKNKTDSSRIEYSVKGIGIGEFNAIDLDGGEIKPESLDMEDKDAIVDQIHEALQYGEEFQKDFVHLVDEKIIETFPDFSLFKNKNNKPKN
ncbi:MAG: hypothetical protein EBS09_11525 [Flavobacteriia bacterium]|nr:hypothetical protein [Flavobacteriia bacterium]